jgi:uncharacterized protein YdiU (UPF0061 family)
MADAPSQLEHKMPWNFDNSYFRELEGFYAPWQLDPPLSPSLLVWNEVLADELGITPPPLDSPALTEIFSGGVLPPGSNPIALAYAGHQFGHFSPQLGDGRALLLGEQITPTGARFDIQLKGSGRTPFSRNGDGKSAVGPALREYLVSEAMAALGVPTTRSLAVALTGETVVRLKAHPGAVLTRVASSHIRVGTFQFFDAHLGTDHVRKLADYAIARHYPQAARGANPYLAFLEAVMDAQIRLVAAWVHIGFVHGVMNTDNVAISGETLDYGPCAFMDSYAARTSFSSIDANGRYAYGNQPGICSWNIRQLAVALAGVIGAIDEQDIARTNQLLDSFADRYQAVWLEGLRAKLGLTTTHDDDAALAARLFATLEDRNVDFTRFFRRLGQVPQTGSEAVSGLFADPAAIRPWLEAWQSRLAREPVAAPERLRRMNAVNPVTIPRNHQVEEVLAAAEAGDMAPFLTMLEAVQHPFEESAEWAPFASPAPASFGQYVTFCGT